MRRALFLGLMVATAASTALLAKPPATISGYAKIVDGDSLEIGATRIRLFGIAAPEGRQHCTRAAVDWPCGAEAGKALKALIGSQPIDCVQRDVDQYERVVAVCKQGNVDLGAEMVKAGLALAYRHYSNDYVGEEDDARRAKRGMWAGDFTAPWDYRHSTPGTHDNAEPLAPRAPPPAERPRSDSAQNCAIKGNINRNGERIYHLPGTPGYDETRIDPSQGERWFCSAEEAMAAGWRAPRGHN